MAWVIQLAGGIPWDRVGEAAATAYTWGSAAASLASSAASHSYATAAALPTECKQAGVHAALVCAGHPPTYNLTPGFGWLLVGIAIGSAVTTIIFLSCLRSRGSSGRPTAQEREKIALLTYIQEHGRPGLQEMARVAQRMEAELLYRSVGLPINTVREEMFGNGFHDRLGAALFHGVFIRVRVVLSAFGILTPCRWASSSQQMFLLPFRLRTSSQVVLKRF